jgi:hypothetical protein
MICRFYVGAFDLLLIWSLGAWICSKKTSSSDGAFQVEVTDEADQSRQLLIRIRVH